MAGKLALRQEVVAKFTDALTALQDSEIYPMPPADDFSTLVTQQAEGELELATGLFVDCVALGCNAAGEPAGVKPSHAEFSLKPAYRMGREDSHNQVFFGRLALSGVYFNETDTEAEVSVKPTKDREALLGELSMLHLLNRLDIPTFRPFGFMTMQDGKTDHLITFFEQGVETMDTIEWRILDDDEKWAHLDRVVETLFCLHSQMLFHNDLEFKNVASDEMGDMIIVDPEYMTNLRDVANTIIHSDDKAEVEKGIHAVKRQISIDLSSACYSINKLILRYLDLPPERKLTEMAKLKLYRKHLFEPYHARLQDSQSPYAPVLLEAYSHVLREWKQLAREMTPRHNRGE